MSMFGSLFRLLTRAITITVIILMLFFLYAYIPSSSFALLNHNLNLSNLTAAASNIVNQSSNAMLGPMINQTWADSFFGYLNQNRTALHAPSLKECPALDSFAAVRFNTMENNISISHYGYDSDFYHYFGNVYNTYFEEEVLYPDGFAPQAYIQDVINKAPIHWQGLVNGTYLNYGYYIAKGLDYEVTGPNYGATLCPVTEIPGPNINVPQFFAQYGCSAQVANVSWFVIEMASACPG